MIPPFVVFSLPRSRSAWLSTVFCSSGHLVGHDIGIKCKTPDQFIEELNLRGGTCETGAAFAWKSIQRKIPNVRFAVVLRDPIEVNKSLEQLGLNGYLPELQKRYSELLEIAKQPGVFSCTYEELKDTTIVANLYQYCTGQEAVISWINKLQETNIQINIKDRLQDLVNNAEQIANLKQQIAALNIGLHIELEPWSDSLWADTQSSAEAHFNEVDADVEPNRPFKLDKDLMTIMQESGNLIILTARIDSQLVGYLSWQIVPDVESQGLLIAQQGAWYVQPDYPKVALQLFNKSVDILKQRGVKCIFPHHRTQGRGADIGKFFKRRGAKLIQHTYSLWIGD